jgi:hypothetical protein
MTTYDTTWQYVMPAAVLVLFSDKSDSLPRPDDIDVERSTGLLFFFFALKCNKRLRFYQNGFTSEDEFRNGTK